MATHHETGQVSDIEEATTEPKTAKELCQMVLDHLQLKNPNQAAAPRPSEPRERSNTLRLAKQVGPLYANCRLETFAAKGPRMQAALDFVTEYVADMPTRAREGEGLVLYGPVGTGKDHLAIAAGFATTEKYQASVEFLNCAEWYGEIRDAMAGRRSEASLIEYLTDPHVLILSDPVPTAGQLGQHMATMLYRLLDQRYRKQKINFVTLNVNDEAEADSRLTSPVWDRMVSNTWLKKCDWPTHRQPARKGD